jgi:murein DD-endopeptidase MepM/ murein hydrolase activator NlpD
VPQRLHDARHRIGRGATKKPRHLIAGLALPTAAAVALMFIAAGTAVATTQPDTLMKNAAAMTVQPPVVETAAMRNRHLQQIAQAQAVAKAESLAQAQAVARSQAIASAQAVAKAQVVANAAAAARSRVVARGVARKKLAVKAAGARRAALVHSWRLPITNPVKTSGFGFRWGRLHAGEDFAVSTGTPLASMSTGTVKFAGVESGYGNLVQIRYWDGTVSYFAHMSTISVNVGEAVAPGEIVGRSGNTGHSTGPHLHLEIHPSGGPAIDPLPWLAARNIAP